MKKKAPLLVFSIILLVVVAVLLNKSELTKPNEDAFLAPGYEWQSEKKVEDYYVSNLRMTEKDLEVHKNRLVEGDDISFYVTEDSTLEGILNNLEYYGFIRSKEALKYALENTTDDTSGKDKAIHVGKTGTIDINAYYEISENMSAWDIANNLLNKPNYIGAHGDYGYLFMP